MPLLPSRRAESSPASPVGEMVRLARRLESQHVAHRVEAGLLLLEPGRRAQRTTSQRVAALRAMDQFEAFALPAEDHGVVANRITGAQPDHRNPLARAP